MTALAILMTPPARAGESGDWLQWGGPTRDFKLSAEKVALAERWPDAGPTRRWSRTLGPGCSSILAQSGRLYTMYRDGRDEIVICLDATDGKTIWEHRYTTGRYDDMTTYFGEGPNATPLIVGDRIISVGVAGELRCLKTTDGALLWRCDLTKEYGHQPRKEEYGFSCCPILHEDRVILPIGGEKHGVIALRPSDGSVIWKSGPDNVSYAPPAIIRDGARSEVLFYSPAEVIALDAKDGAACWRWPCRNPNENNCTAAIQCDPRHVWAATQTEGAARLLRLGDESKPPRVEQVWFRPKIRVFHWNVVCVGDYLYGSFGGSDRSRLGVVDWRQGTLKLMAGPLHAATCIYVDGRLILLDSRGVLGLARVTPGRLDLMDSAQVLTEPAWAAPTLVGTTLYLRDTRTIAALDLG